MADRAATGPAPDPLAHSEEWPRGVPEHVTRPLLDRIIEQSMDEEYRQVALRRAGRPTAPATRRARLLAAAMVAAFGVLVTVAAVQTSANADVVDASRTTLISRIADEREQSERQQARIASLQDDTIALEDELDDLTADLEQTTAEQRRLAVRTGYVAVRGGGVRITVDDNPDGDASQLVRDEDLAMLVDGLWQAGAEAIAINDRRLTALSGIHNRGIAIEVGNRPVNPPYVVQAVGDVDTLAADLLDTTHGEDFFALATGLGFPYTLDNVQEMTLPAAREPVLRHVGRGTAAKPNTDGKEAKG